MIRITRTLAIPDTALRERFVHAAGPGGQNVNKVATAVQLRLDLRLCPELSPRVSERLYTLARGRITRDGVLVIEARRFRTQERNRRDARERLIALLRRAATLPRARRATQPTATSRQARLTTKRRHGEIKRARGSERIEDD
jgi:ribosome-associated protein